MRDTLTRQQRRAAQLRGRGWSLTEIAKELGVSTRTLVRWNRLPAFRGEQARTRDELDAEQPLSLGKRSKQPSWPRSATEARTGTRGGKLPAPWPHCHPRSATPSRRYSRSA